jgi:hypothetical protein
VTNETAAQIVGYQVVTEGAIVSMLLVNGSSSTYLAVAHVVVLATAVLPQVSHVLFKCCGAVIVSWVEDSFRTVPVYLLDTDVTLVDASDKPLWSFVSFDT